MTETNLTLASLDETLPEIENEIHARPYRGYREMGFSDSQLETIRSALLLARQVLALQSTAKTLPVELTE